MNRIILIGNGFDLAHGLPTSYKSFIDYCWKKIFSEARQKEKEYEDEYIKLTTNIKTLAHVISESDSEYSLKELEEQISSFVSINKAKVNFTINNKFFGHISKKSDLNNWVDIENEYYNSVKCLLYPSRYSDACYYRSIALLNEDFEVVKKKLEFYLKEVMAKNHIDEISNIREIIYSDFKLKDFTVDGVSSIAEKEYIKIGNYGLGLPEDLKFSKKTIDNIDLYRLLSLDEFKQELKSEYVASNYFDLIPENILFLNFNYTNTERLYIQDGLFSTKEMGNIYKESIHIHGKLNKKGNPIIFGYGDEIGKAYLEIENLNDNIYLENIKSTKYLEADNYKRLISFIQSDKYQVFILGHSCGSSDRTLLNKLFEDDNCVSIKVYYHKKADGTDNYSDVIRNITRNFKDKVSMRDKVVNKDYCQPLVGRK